MKPKRFVVGLTGGIATGKSTALDEFARLGDATICLDQIARRQAQPGGEGYRAIVRAFGRKILRKDGTLDRGLLGRLVFRDKAARSGLEKATHPAILREMTRSIGRRKGVVIVDAPLLFEKNLQSRFDAVVLVACSPRRQIRRLVARDRLTPKQARRRIRAQWSLVKKRALADVTIDNDSVVAGLRARVRSYHAGLQLLYGGTPNGNAH
ncbi:MAG: dephospho-CoA kinase [Elusimicrobiota bacterium]